MRTLIIGCGYVGLALGAELEAVGVRPLFGDITRTSDLAQLPGGFDWVANTVSSAHGGTE